MRLIDADALYFAKRYAKEDPDSDRMIPVRAVDKSVIDAATVYVFPEHHSRWEDYGAGVCCENCGSSFFHQDENNNFGIEPINFAYCPHCGAKMDLEV